MTNQRIAKLRDVAFKKAYTIAHVRECLAECVVEIERLQAALINKSIQKQPHHNTCQCSACLKRSQMEAIQTMQRGL